MSWFNENKRAFTMAEAILVMTILGIIATIMISTLKPAEFQEKGLQVLAKKVLSEIDTATTQILMNNSANGTMETIYQADTLNFIVNTSGNASHKLGNLYKKYLTGIRSIPSGSYCSDMAYNVFYLKDGACFGIDFTSYGGGYAETTCFPGETTPTDSLSEYGFLYFDINGKEKPNVFCKDIFILPLASGGIDYESVANN